ncbi:MAG: spore maturation protein [Deltaproteobacteria bacterium]|nr:spore maturation protein [Deltaproteobacteria bacterium]
MPQVTEAGINAAKTSVELAIGLVGQMALWLGFMRIVRDAGLMAATARGLGRILRPLFKDIPDGHPAMGAVVMNLAANMLGLANAATPFGLKAMRELDKLNPRPGVTTNSMSMFLAINTSGVAVLPLGVIGIRATLGSTNAAGIVIPSILATACSTITAVIVAKLLEDRRRFAPERFEATLRKTDSGEIEGMDEAQKVAELAAPTNRLGLFALLVFAIVLFGLMVRSCVGLPAEQQGFTFVKDVLSSWLLPVLMAMIVAVGLSRTVRVYESFVQGAKEGFDIAVMIIPYLVAILVGIGMFRASGLMELFIGTVEPITSLVGLPPELLPMAMIRPLSGSGAMGVMTDTMKTYGPDSLLGFTSSVMNGSTETTFYVLAVYFGSVGVRATRHTLYPCIAADLVGLLSAVYWSGVFFSPTT